ncbi:MAG: glycosyltransferase family 4 protein [Bacteroidales bacterium]|nr:glycosyltransferase family 4 protein [Bacteroidales bacterium]
MKILWLAPYPIDSLKEYVPELQTLRPLKGTWLFNLLDEFGKLHQLSVHVVTYTSKLDKDVTLQVGNLWFHIISYRIPIIKKGYPNYFPINKLISFPALRARLFKVIKKVHPDIIHVHGTEGVYGLVPLDMELPVIVSVQGIISEIYRRQITINHYLQRRIERKVLKSYTHFGFRTDFDKDFILRSNSKAITHYLPEAINPIFFNSHWVYNKKQEVTFVGTISKMKGIDKLVDAFIEIIKYEKLKIKLNLIGTGDKYFLDLLNQKLKKCQLENEVVFHGFREPGYIKDVLLRSNLFILPTLMDNSPNSLMEGQALGVPCAASNIGGIPSLIEHEYNGFLFNPNDKNAIRECIISALSNKDILNAISNNSRKTAYERNYPLKVAQITLDVYNKIINENH